MPIDIPYGYSQQLELSITLPKDFKVESIPVNPINIENEFGEYHITITATGNIVNLTRHFEQIGGRFLSSTYNDFRDFLLAVSNTDDMKMVLVSE